MPGPHARFLNDLEAIANIQGYVKQHAENSSLTSAYNGAVESLTSLRNTHIKLVSRYIILPSRQPVPEEFQRANNLAAASSTVGSRRRPSVGYVGTGGSQLVPFLQSSRDETKAAKIQHC
jgi:indoleamine 2,3-dioxygenase